jgi:geranylgeranyl diphosphate synthase type I
MHLPPIASEHLAAVEAAMVRLVRADEAPQGVVSTIALEHLATGGKRLRARLALAATAALGGTAAWGTAWAAACELAHNATLIHDDLQDGDTVRRGQPTTWRQHGAAQAINAGDLLLILPFAAVQDQARRDGGWEIAGLLQQVLAQQLTTVIRGQAAECALTASGEVSRQAYLQMVGQKTAALFTLPVQGAAVVSGAALRDAADVAAPFAPLGTLFQLQDDVLDLYGDKGRGAVGSDLREGKVSALVVEHLALHPADRFWLMELLRQPRAATEQAGVDRAIEGFAAGGALKAVLQAIEVLAAQAKAEVKKPLEPLLHGLLASVMAPIAHLTSPG